MYGKALERLSYFYFEESCGQCTPCREGTGWLYRIVNRIEHGKGKMEDMELLDNIANNIQGRTICALGDAAAMPVRAMVQHFRDESRKPPEANRGEAQMIRPETSATNSLSVRGTTDP